MWSFDCSRNSMSSVDPQTSSDSMTARWWTDGWSRRRTCFDRSCWVSSSKERPAWSMRAHDSDRRCCHDRSNLEARAGHLRSSRSPAPVRVSRASSCRSMSDRLRSNERPAAGALSHSDRLTDPSMSSNAQRGCRDGPSPRRLAGANGALEKRPLAGNDQVLRSACGPKNSPRTSRLAE